MNSLIITCERMDLVGVKATTVITTTVQESHLKGELAIGTPWTPKQKNNAHDVRSNSPGIITVLCTGLDSLS